MLIARSSLLLVLLSLVLKGWLTAAASASTPPEDPLLAPAVRSDARLRDVTFVSPERGWAVGDRGVIWQTDDGGRTWQSQESGVGCALNSVFFLDDQTGWAAGGYTQPYSHTGVGVLVSTRDGGRSWRPTPRLALPLLRKVQFFNARHGVAIGTPSALFPSGLLSTDSGGLGWVPMAGEGAADWRTGDFIDLHTGALAGRDQSTATVRRAGFEAVSRPGSLRGIWRMQLTSPATGWLVGDGGLILHTQDLGASWQTPPGLLPEEIARQFDLRALCVRGGNIWVAGAPGSRVLHSPDGGRTWQAFATGCPTPLEAIHFVDDRRGWAVGALGTILATEDGGQTWRKQRAGGTRAAVVGLFADVDDAPLELVARLGGNDGYLSVVEVLGRRDVEIASTREIHAADRLHEAVCAVGGTHGDVAWRFPLRQYGLTLSAEQIVELWNRASDGRGVQELEDRVCRTIRQWRPEIIVTHDANPRGEEPLAHIINQIVLSAARSAADPTRFPQQITHAGLEPWSVKKVFAGLPNGARGSIELTTAQLATRLGRSVAEAAATPRGLIDERFEPVRPSLGFRLLMNNMPGEQTQRDFFTGIALSPGSEARREWNAAAAENLDALRRMAERRRNAQAILERVDREAREGVSMLGHVGELTRGLDDDSAAQLLYQLGDQYYRRGHWDLTAETFAMLAERHTEHPLARPALVWLVQYYAGAEANWRMSSDRRFGVQQASTFGVNPAHMEQRADKAAAWGKEIERTRPDLFAEPSVRFALAAAHRQQGYGKQAERFYAMQSRAGDVEGWRACALGETWLDNPKDLPPKPMYTCVIATSKPRLDGVLDDALWQRAKSASLRSPWQDDQDWPAAVMLAYDQEFLYIGVKCRRAAGANYEATPGARPRDPDLANRDRVEILLDLDRDYATYYRLTIDHRGWVADECWGDRSWNPTWFVAAAEADGAWTAEAAVPLVELTGKPPQSRAVWAVGLQRVAPNAGFQSWSTPAAATVRPEGFGFLLFE